MSFYIIHFSDIHIKGEDDLVLSRTESIKKTCAGSILPNSDVALVVSGDIAFSGKDSQYEVAKEFFDEISHYLKNEKNAHIKMIVVPGNHDCDFSEASSVRDTLIQNIKPDIDIQYYDAVIEIQKQYTEFAKEYDSAITGMISSKEIELGGEKILFLLINTAWMSTLHEEHGKLILPAFSIPSINTDKYKMVFAVFHHPEDWLNPDYKQDFISFIRKNADFALVGHEHLKDNYQKAGSQFSVIYNHGKELQDSGSAASGFSIIEIQDTCQEYCVYDFIWDTDAYRRQDGEMIPFVPNRLVTDVAFRPNKEAISFANDFGVVLHHFAKDSLSLSDLFVWPELNKVTYKIDKKVSVRIRNDVLAELLDNSCSIIVGSETSGKTALAKRLYIEFSTYDSCCIYLDGQDLKTADPKKMVTYIENCYSKQYKANSIDEFRRLSKDEKILIVDNFDKIRLRGEKRNAIFELLTASFGQVFIFVSSDVELPTLIPSSAFSDETPLSYYEILPFGNSKRKELIDKWYSLNTDGYDEVDIQLRIENSVQQVDTFLGNGSGFLPAYPLCVLSVLAYSNSTAPTYNGSQYGFLYETMIQKSLATISPEYKSSGAYNIDVGIVSSLAFNILQAKETSFSEMNLVDVVNEFNAEKKQNISPTDLIKKMCEAKIFFHDNSEGDLYRFRYPYIFYYFAGRYIAYHYNEKAVQDMIDYMSEKLYIESYGNIMIFVCHFANNSNVVDTILLSAYTTLEHYDTFDFGKSSPTVTMLADLVDSLMPKVVSSANDVTHNKDAKLTKLDDAGINDGSVIENETIDETVEEGEKDLASIAASFKTMEVLGQILQNYPGDISGENKTEIISEIHNMSMRTVKAMITALSQIEDDFVQFVVARTVKKGYSKAEIEQAARKLMHFLTAGMARGMISQVALALNSKYLLQAAEESLVNNGSISARLIYTELRVNKLKQFSLKEIKGFKEELERDNERFALCVLGSIMSTYLNYNDCDYQMRAKICSMFGFSERKALTSRHSNLLEERV